MVRYTREMVRMLRKVRTPRAFGGSLRATDSLLVALALVVFSGCSSKESGTQAVGLQPTQGPYSPCDDRADCSGDGATCLVDDDGVGVCSAPCASTSSSELDPSVCPPAPADVTSGIGCLPAVGAADEWEGNCVIECTEVGLACPSGMGCVEEILTTPTGFEVVTHYCR